MTVSYHAAAELALRAWCTGALTGDWQVLCAMLAEDATVQLPLAPPHNGPRIGAIEIRALFDVVAHTIKVRLDQHPIGVLAHDGGQRFACELLGTGTVAGHLAHVSICLWFTFDDHGAVSAIREYIGDAPPVYKENI